MKRRKEDIAEWVVAKASELHEIALRVHKAYPLDPKIDEFKANPWTILKLFVLLHYVPVYTSIIRERYDKMIYIDLFSGSGLLAYKNTEVPVAGSPIVTLYVALEPFDYAFLNDLSKKKRELLGKRISYLKEHNLINVYDISCTRGDANSIIYEILENLIGKKVHGLIFIDPSGLEFRWASLEALLKVRLRFDIIMLYQSYSVAMQALSRIRREREGVKAEALHVFIGDKDWLSYLKEQGGKELSRVEIERLMLEYIHAAEYLGLIKKGNIKNEIFWFPDFSSFKEEKRRIIKENRGRCFESSIISPPFTENEKKAMLKIVLNYERARDFLLWFLDFNNKFPNIWSFDEMDFREYAEPIFIFGPIEKGKKGRHLLKREIDGKIWKIPNENPYDYTRLVSFVFPSWFKELGLIDEVIVFPEFSEDKKMWYMYYPIKMSDEEFLRLDMFEILEESFFKEDVKSVWIPYLIYVIARKYYCSTSAIKKSIINLYEKYPEHIHLGRAPLHLLKRRHKDSYIKIGGFFRSYLNMIKREEDEQ